MREVFVIVAHKTRKCEEHHPYSTRSHSTFKYDDSGQAMSAG